MINENHWQMPLLKHLTMPSHNHIIPRVLPNPIPISSRFLIMV